MGSYSDPIARCMQNVDDAYRAYNKGDPSAKATLYMALEAMQRAVDPGFSAVKRIFETTERIVSVAAIHSGLLDAILKRKGQPVDTKTLAKEIHQDPLFLCRLLRVMAVAGHVDEVGKQTYRANQMTHILDQPSIRGAVRTGVEVFWPATAKTAQEFSKPEFQMFADDEHDVKCVFERNMGVSMWEFLGQNATLKESFDSFMTGRRPPGAVTPWWEVIDIEKTAFPDVERNDDPKRVLLVDIGGGKGHDMGAFIQRFPTPPGRLILQDLPETFERFPKTDFPKTLELMPHDILTSQPIQGARIYYLRSILHDWSDKQCQKILRNLIDAMDPQYSALMIEEYVLPDQGCSWLMASTDIAMMMGPGGIERTRDHWSELLGSVGLDIVNIWRHGTQFESVIEARRKVNGKSH